MTYPTREQLEEYIRNNKLDTDESYPRSDWWKFKQQRDELIKDIAKLRERNAELEKKAHAFDEIEGLVSKTKSAEDLGECVLQLLIENKEANHER